jgi:hypothetical protein
VAAPASLWELPGAQAFLTELRDRLERGDHVTLMLPRDLDSQLTIEQARRTMPLFAHRTFDAAALAAREHDPLLALTAELGLRIPPGEVPSEEHLAEHPDAAGLLIWVDGLGSADERLQGAWGRVLHALARATRRASPDAFPPRVVVVLDRPVDALEPTDPGWSSTWWWGRLGWLDVALHLQRLDPALAEDVRSVAVELAGFDLNAAERLALDVRQVPRDVADALAEEHAARASLPLPLDDAARCQPTRPGLLADPWSAGIVDRFDGRNRPFWHSCLFAEEAGLVTLRRRIWRGQVRSLLPRLEEWRVELVERAKADGLVAEDVPLDRLDFAVLHDTLRKGAQTRGRAECTALAAWLRSTRNMIAHLEPVDDARRREGERLATRVLR